MDNDKLTTLAGRDGWAARVPTMRDVAALAGVSIKTVSRVVNQEPGVAPELVGRVLDAVGLLGYRHNLTASSLRRADHKTATIGLLLEDISNPFSSALHRAIEDVARHRGTLVLAGSSDEDPDRQQELLHALVSRRVDGLIAVPASGNQNALLRERRLGRPMVLVDRLAPEADSVVVDNRAGVGQALRHLAAHGHRRIAFLGDLRSIWTATERHAGYVEALAAEGIMLNPHLVRMDVHGIDVAEAVVRELLAAADPPTALIAGRQLPGPSDSLYLRFAYIPWRGRVPEGADASGGRQHGALACAHGAPRGIRPPRQIRRRVTAVGLAGSRRVCPAHVGCVVARVGARADHWTSLGDLVGFWTLTPRTGVVVRRTVQFKGRRHGRSLRGCACEAVLPAGILQRRPRQDLRSLRTAPT